ncbi:MAG: VCBS repeat-containing protein [Phycisphaerales bacterium]|nr:VCBS repeat-containing protein [Phycisphaerales bacterium]
MITRLLRTNLMSIPGILALVILAAPARADDCDGDGIDDAQAIADGLVPDCNHNGVPDSCDIYLYFTSYDLDDSGTPDECDIADGTMPDCNTNGLYDYCDVFGCFDFQGNFVGGGSADCDNNVIPDECQEDCNANGQPDVCDIRLGESTDCNGNRVPDECDFAGGGVADCNANGIIDTCDLRASLAFDLSTLEFAIDHTGFALNPIDVNVADMNRDGWPDIVTANRSFPLGLSVGVFLNNQDGTFQPGVVYTAGIDAENAAVADFDGDLWPDVAVTVRRTAGWGIDILRNTGGGVLVHQASLAAGQVAIDVVAADLDGDGDMDLAATDINGGRLVLLFNTAGSFGAPVFVPTGPRPIYLTAADLDGDADMDLAVNVQNTSAVYVFLNNGNGTFASPTLLTEPEGGNEVEAVDLDNDGDLDLVVGLQSYKEVGAFLNNGDGTFGPIIRSAGPGDNTVALTVGDYDGDGLVDAAISTSSGILPGAAAVLRGNGDGTFLGPVSWIVGDSPLSITTGDFDGDGRADLATGVYQEEVVRLMLNRTTAATSVDVNGNGVPDECECPGDLDGNLSVDLADLSRLLSNFGTGSGAIYEQGDLDGDGDVDLADLSGLLARFGASC